MSESFPQTYYDGARQEMLDYVPSSVKMTLEVGCGRGQFSEALRQRWGVTAWGIEQNETVAREAESRLDRVLVGDVATQLDAVPDATFDCAIFNDVLEHLISPGDVLRETAKKVRPSGWIVCSIPNVLHVSVLKGLLVDRDFRYQRSGIMDETHLRFFTRKSIDRLLREAGLDVELIEGIRLHRSALFTLINLATFGYYRDSAATQFACRARVPA